MHDPILLCCKHMFCEECVSECTFHPMQCFGRYHAQFCMHCYFFLSIGCKFCLSYNNLMLYSLVLLLRLEVQEHPRCVFGSQTVADALKLLWQNQTCAVAVVDRQTKKLVGNARNSDIYNLVKNDELLRNRRILTVEEFLRREAYTTDAEPIIENDHGADQTAGSLHLKNSFKSIMDSPVTNKENDTLKKVMEQMARTNSSFSFLINDNEQVTGLITVRYNSAICTSMCEF